MSDDIGKYIRFALCRQDDGSLEITSCATKTSIIVPDSDIESLIGALQRSRQTSFKELVQRTLGLLEFSQEVACIQVDGGSAVANKALVCLKPSDRLLRVLSAITAGDFDSLLVEHNNLLKQKYLSPGRTELSVLG